MEITVAGGGDNKIGVIKTTVVMAIEVVGDPTIIDKGDPIPMTYRTDMTTTQMCNGFCEWPNGSRG